MDQGPLVIDQIEGGARFLGEFQKYMPVQTAFWLKESDEGEWNLYVASGEITDDNFDIAYGEVLRIAGELRDALFDPFQVKLIGTDDPLAKAASEIDMRSYGRVAARLNGKVFGNFPVDEVYIYPSPVPVSAT